MDCSIDGCNRPVKTRGWCALHYQRWYHHGDPKPDLVVAGEPRRWIADLAKQPMKDGCIQWPFFVQGNGYGTFTIGRKTFAAHRWICQAVHGAPPTKAHQAAHSCGNRWCVSPKHLRWATPSENAADKLLHGTDGRGEKNHVAKLTANDVRDIRVRLAAGQTQVSIAALYNVTQANISAIKRGVNWSHTD